MDKPTKLQEIELQELKDFQKQSEVLIAQLGQLSFKKLQIEKEEEYLKSQYDKITATEVELGKKLKETYGNVQIDLKEGDITYS
jgi:stress response protein YsnF